MPIVSAQEKCSSNNRAGTTSSRSHDAWSHQRYAEPPEPSRVEICPIDFFFTNFPSICSHFFLFSTETFSHKGEFFEQSLTNFFRKSNPRGRAILWSGRPENGEGWPGRAGRLLQRMKKAIGVFKRKDEKTVPTTPKAGGLKPPAAEAEKIAKFSEVRRGDEECHRRFFRLLRFDWWLMCSLGSRDQE